MVEPVPDSSPQADGSEPQGLNAQTEPQVPTEEVKGEEEKDLGTLEGVKNAPAKGRVPKEKLYEVIKALSAMRLCKEDCVPCPVLCHKINPVEGEIPFVPAIPIAEGVVSEIALEVEASRRGEPCLFQGSIGSAYNQKALNDAGITHILTAASKIGPRFKNDFTYKVLPLLDTPAQNIVQFFETASQWIEEVLSENPSHKVLIHCFAGKSRASTMTCAYLMQKQRLNLRQCLLHLRACRPIAYPNIGFLVQLKAYESTVFGCCSDVPLRLAKLFGIEEPAAASESAGAQEPALSEEMKSEAKALGDAEEQLQILQKQKDELAGSPAAASNAIAGGPTQE